MKKLLLISPHFPPVNAPDMQRARLALPHLRSLGWEPTVLAIHPESIERPVIDPALEQTYPDDIRVIRVRGLSPRITRAFGFGSLWLRTGRALRAAGDRLLSAERFDLVFLSTTQFAAFTLGPRWKRRFGVPFVLDYQDPWVNDHYARTGQPPPGGALKFAFSQWRARQDEPRAVQQAAGVISVSESYIHDLSARHPRFDASLASVIPFGSSTEDLRLSRSISPSPALVPFGDGNLHLVYTGRGGADMTAALTLLFRAFRRLRDSRPDVATRIRFHFIGTSYAPAHLAQETIMPVARAEKVAEHVSEHPVRVPYFEALHYMIKADVILALGSDDPSYNPSKTVPCLIAGRPLIAALHKSSPALALARRAGACAVELSGGEDGLAKIATWLAQDALPVPDAIGILADHSAETMTRRLVSFFNQAVQR